MSFLERLIGPGVRVARARYGKGVYAARRFRPEQIIGEVQGRIINDPEYGSDYCMDLGENLSLEPECAFRFLNHSCEPNCTLLLEESDPAEGRLPRMYVQALKEIRTNEQLTIDYAWAADSAIPCECESEQCRGWIVAKSELSLVVTEHDPYGERGPSGA